MDSSKWLARLIIKAASENEAVEADFYGDGDSTLRLIEGGGNWWVVEIHTDSCSISYHEDDGVARAEFGSRKKCLENNDF